MEGFGQHLHTMINKQLSAVEKMEKEAVNFIKDMVDEGFSLGETWGIALRVIEKLNGGIIRKN